MGKADIRRRWLGAIFLTAAAVMVITGETVLHSRLNPLAFAVFWLVCLAFTSAAIIVALRDLSAIRNRTRKEQRALFEDTLKDIARSAEKKARDSDRKGEN